MSGGQPNGTPSTSTSTGNSAEWVKSPGQEENEYSISNLRLMDEETQKGLLFKALRG